MKYAEYIKKLEIDSLWNGRKHIAWELDRHINILSGVNGVGKSTILNKVISPLQLISMGEASNIIELQENDEMGPVHLDLMPADATSIRFDVIRSFDRPLVNHEIAMRLDFKIASELDLQLYNLQRRYLDYQVNIANKIIQALQSGDTEAATRMSEGKKQFYDIVDKLFADTSKTIIRTENEIRFRQLGETLTPYQLSSGEKQMMLILLTVLVENGEPYVLFMDEPEVSLHIEWQKQLIGVIMQLNPNVQIILTTHSPAVVMDGWMDRITEVSDIEVQ